MKACVVLRISSFHDDPVVSAVILEPKIISSVIGLEEFFDVESRKHIADFKNKFVEYKSAKFITEVVEILDTSAIADIAIPQAKAVLDREIVRKIQSVIEQINSALKVNLFEKDINNDLQPHHSVDINTMKVTVFNVSIEKWMVEKLQEYYVLNWGWKKVELVHEELRPDLFVMYI